MKYTTVICQSCAKSFEIMTWKLGQGRGKTCSNECRHLFQKKVMSRENSVWWKGGKSIMNGYRVISRKGHHLANKAGYVYEHRLIMEESLGRPLKRTEIVHHINRNKLDNRIENLQLVGSVGEHRHLHKGERYYNTSCICGKQPVAKGMCKLHYGRYYLTGVPDYTVTKHPWRV